MKRPFKLIYCFTKPITTGQTTQKCPPYVFAVNALQKWNTSDHACEPPDGKLIDILSSSLSQQRYGKKTAPHKADASDISDIYDGFFNTTAKLRSHAILDTPIGPVGYSTISVILISIAAASLAVTTLATCLFLLAHRAESTPRLNEQPEMNIL